MLVAGCQLPALVGKPLVQFLKAGKLPPLVEEALPDKPNLLLDLPLLPAGGWRAGHRLEQVMGGHGNEPTVEDPFLPHQHLADHCLQVVIDPFATGPTKEVECPDMGIQN